MSDKPTGEPAATADGPPERSRARGVIRRITGSFWFNLIAAFVVLGLVQGFLVRLYTVPSSSMATTLEPGDRILVNRLAYVGGPPVDGDVVVFNASSAWDAEGAPPKAWWRAAIGWVGGLIGIGPTNDHTLVKRLIAGPGQRISCCNVRGQLLVDGTARTEPYINDDLPFTPGTLDCTTTPESQRCFGPLTVPAGSYVAMGDNRGDSSDSVLACRGQRAPPDSCLRLVRRGDIVGRVFAIVLPPGRWGAV